jgi:hypothetical protein
MGRMKDQLAGDEPYIPERFKRPCEFCGLPLNTEADGSHQYTSGWVKVRSAGGGHGISLPKRENRWAHGHCVDRASQGLAKQGRLW